MKKVLALAATFLLLLVTSILAQDFCEGDFTYDGDVDADDVTTFLEHFGREQYYKPCPPDGPAPVAKTGQTDNYVIGSDGDLKRGVAWPHPRFTDNLDGTITDNLTGLIWLKNANCFGTREFDYAVLECLGLSNGECGLSDGSAGGDWRLPNRFELESLLDLAYYNPALSDTAGTGQWSQGDPFDNVQSIYYWSSSRYAAISYQAWPVNMYSADVQPDSGVYYVWCCRGGH